MNNKKKEQTEEEEEEEEESRALEVFWTISEDFKFQEHTQ